MRLAIHIILLCASLNAFSNVADSLFLAGNQHYQNEAYEKAIVSYLAVDSSQHAHALYHNLGNCYYQTGNIPRSILFYEKALLLKKDTQTQFNLKIAKKRIQEIEAIPTLFFIRWWKSLASFLHTNYWLLFFGVFIWISSFLLFSFLKNRQKRTFNLFLTTVSLTLILGAIAQKSNALENERYAIVMEKAELFSDTSYSKSDFLIPAGNKVLLLEFSNELTFIKLPNGRVGWIVRSSSQAL